MPSPFDVLVALIESIAYDISKRWLLYILMIGAGHFIFRYIFDRLKARREVIVFWLAAFVLLAGLGSFLGTKPQEPNLIGAIQNIITGGYNGGKDTVAALEITVMNAGSMQSIAKNWKVEASVNGTKYDGTFGDMPQTFTFNIIDKAKSNESPVIL